MKETEEEPRDNMEYWKDLHTISRVSEGRGRCVTPLPDISLQLWQQEGD
jgi:hypothetical protein